MSAKNYLTLFRALKTDYAYLIALMGFSWLSIYGYQGTWYFHDVLATFSLLLALRCAYFHFALLVLIAIVPLGNYPLMGIGGLPSDNLFGLVWLNPLKAIEVSARIPLGDMVPSIILLVLVGVLTVLQRMKTTGFNILRLESLVVFASTVIFSALFNGFSTGWGWDIIDYPPVSYWITFIVERIYG